MSKGVIGRGKWQRRSREEWQAVFSRFASAGLSVAAFCARESISEANFYRWRALLSTPQASASATSGFVDLGQIMTGAARTRLELKLDLGDGVMLHLVRG